MTREEAIKVVKSATVYTPKEIEALETLIPEFTQSEDDRIRKGLIEALKTSKTVGELKFILPEPTREEAIAYLEKQKEQKPWKVGANAYFTPEQKPVEGDNETEIQKAFREGKSAGRKEVFDHPEEYGLQKPVVWSEEDKEAIEMCFDAIPKKWKTKSGLLLTEWLKSLCNSLLKQSDSFCKTNCKGFQETGRCFADGPCVAKQSEEELEKEIDDYIEGCLGGLTGREIASCARYFYELGRQSNQKNENSVS